MPAFPGPEDDQHQRFNHREIPKSHTYFIDHDWPQITLSAVDLRKEQS
jgi:hypothetical protein